MSANKAKGGSNSELTKLKQLDAAKHEVIWSWRAEVPVLTNAQIRNKLATQYHVRLSLDKQLSQFWSWYGAQLDAEATNDELANFEEAMQLKHPDWTPEQIREQAISYFMVRSVARKDPEQFATIVKLEQGERKSKLDERRLDLDVNKFQFDAAKAALDKLPELNAIKRDGSLSEDAKLEQARLKLFGELPE